MMLTCTAQQHWFLIGHTGAFLHVVLLHVLRRNSREVVSIMGRFHYSHALECTLEGLSCVDVLKVYWFTNQFR
jgi:hypothetical protein